MTRSIVRAALAVLAVSLLVAGCSPGGRPLARVGSRTLTSTDLLDAARGNEGQYPANPDSAKRALLDDLVRRELMLESARRRGYDTTAIARQFRANLEDRLGLEALYARLAPQDIGVSEAEARSMYAKRSQNATVRIVYSSDPNTIAGAHDALRRGEAFADVADRFNMPGTVPPGGAIGTVHYGQLVPPLDDVILTLPIGDIGGPYETPQGTFLVTVDARQPAEQPAFEEVQAQYAEMIRQRKVRQTMSRRFLALREEYHVKVLETGAPLLFQFLTPARVGDGSMPERTPQQDAEVLARWNGGQYTVADAFADLQRPDVQKPPAAMTPAIQQWIEGRVITRVAQAEAKRRHVTADPDVARRIRGEFERFLLDSEFQLTVASVGPPAEPVVREVWDMLKHQFQQVSRANVQWAVVADTAAALRIGQQMGQPGLTLEDAVRLSGANVTVHREVVSYPTADPDWISMRETLAGMQPGQWAAPERHQDGIKFMQVIDKVQAEVTFESLTPDMRASLENNAWQLARERRLMQFTDSLHQVLQPRVFVENLASVPWPPPAAIDVGR